MPRVVEAATISWEEEIEGRRLIIRVCAMVEYHNTRLPAWLVWRMVRMVCTIHTVVVYGSGGKDRGRYLGTTAKSAKFID